MLKYLRQWKKWVAGLALFLAALEISGLKYRLYEKDYFTQWDYPMYGDILSYVDAMVYGERPPLDPPFKAVQKGRQFLMNPEGKCLTHDTKIRLVYLVKSAPGHSDRRAAIRRTWGYERRFSDVPVRTVFLLGQASTSTLADSLVKEHDQFGDLVQGDFIDSYYNNTLKTAMGLKWAFEVCPGARFYMFVDDDYYVSTRNVLRFLRNPVNYPKYLEDPTIDFDDVLSQNKAFEQRAPGGRQLKQMIEFDLPEDALLYAGFVMFSRPQRHWLGKWSISEKEYPYHMYPPYVTAGAYVLSSEALKKFYFGSMFVKPYVFDDVYMGILAKKLAIEPFHCAQFWFHRKYPYKIKDFVYTVASHEFSNPTELERVWNEQKQAGNA